MKKLTIIFLLPISFIFLYSCNKEGCTDQTAINYDENADNDDGSCIYDEDGNGNGGSGSGGVDTEDPDYNLAGTTSTPTVIENVYDSDNLFDYYIDGTWTISGPVEIEPGVRILMKSGARVEVSENGSLSAVGTSADKIAFIGEESLEGYWDHIRFNQSNKTANELTHVEIKYGGGNSNSFRDASVFMNGNARLKMNNTLIEGSQRYGFKVRSSDGNLDEFSNNTISQGSSHPIYLNNLGQLENFAGNNDVSTGNAFNKILIAGNSVEFPKDIPFVNATVLLTGTSSVEAAVTIAAGNYFEMGSGARIDVKSGGSLAMIGTASEHITFTGEEQVAGYWDYIRFSDSQSPNNEMQYVDISYGGGNDNSYSNASVPINGSSYLKMGNSSVSYSERHGVKVRSSNGTFDDDGNNTFSNNGLDDINLP